jgi:hypothetical protein
MRLAAVLLLLAAVGGISISGDKSTLASTVTEKAMDHIPTTNHSNLTIGKLDGHWEATIDTVVTIGYNTISVSLSVYGIMLAREQLRAAETFYYFARGIFPSFLASHPGADKIVVGQRPNPV